MPEQITDVVHKLAREAGAHLLRAVLDTEHNLSSCTDEVKKLLNRGAEQAKDSRYDDAIRSFDAAARLDPKSISPRLRMMKVYRAQEQDLTALVVGGGALNLATEPRSRSQIFNFLGEVSFDIAKLTKHHKHLEQAIGFYDEAIDENQDDVIPKWNRVLTYLYYYMITEETDIDEFPNRDQKRADAMRRAKRGIDSVLQMGQEGHGNSSRYWRTILNSKLENWWPEDEWWQGKIDIMQEIAKQSESLEELGDSTQNVATLNDPAVRKVVRNGLIAASIILALLGLAGIPSDADAALPSQSAVAQVADLSVTHEVHSYTVFPDSELGVEHDWDDLAAVERTWESLRSIEHDWEDLA